MAPASAMLRRFATRRDWPLQARHSKTSQGDSIPEHGVGGLAPSPRPPTYLPSSVILSACVELMAEFAAIGDKLYGFRQFPFLCLTFRYRLGRLPSGMFDLACAGPKAIKVTA